MAGRTRFRSGQVPGLPAETGPEKERGREAFARRPKLREETPKKGNGVRVRLTALHNNAIRNQ